MDTLEIDGEIYEREDLDGAIALCLRSLWYADREGYTPVPIEAFFDALMASHYAGLGVKKKDDLGIVMNKIKGWAWSHWHTTLIKQALFYLANSPYMIFDRKTQSCALTGLGKRCNAFGWTTIKLDNSPPDEETAE